MKVQAGIKPVATDLAQAKGALEAEAPAAQEKPPARTESDTGYFVS